MGVIVVCPVVSVDGINGLSGRVSHVIGPLDGLARGTGEVVPQRKG